MKRLEYRDSFSLSHETETDRNGCCAGRETSVQSETGCGFPLYVVGCRVVRRTVVVGGDPSGSTRGLGVVRNYCKRRRPLVRDRRERGGGEERGKGGLGVLDKGTEVIRERMSSGFRQEPYGTGSGSLVVEDGRPGGPSRVPSSPTKYGKQGVTLTGSVNR